MSDDSLSGQTFGDYQLRERIGQGGMADVYRAYQEKLDRLVAVKVLHPLFAADEDARRHFQQEARSVARLTHPHILPVHDYGEAGGRPYLVMELAEGGTLKDLMQAPLSLGQVVSALSQTGQALGYAHARGLVHRDVKPANLLLSQPDWLLLTDFGIATLARQESVTSAGDMGPGTPEYMAPEQIVREVVGPRADIYSLGVMLYELVTGGAPFRGPTPTAVAMAQVSEAPTPAARLNPTLSRPLEAVIARAMAKKQQFRFGSAAEFVQALQDAAGHSAGYQPPRAVRPLG